MSGTDIVAVLRADAECESQAGSGYTANILRLAADEIEKLRREDAVHWRTRRSLLATIARLEGRPENVSPSRNSGGI